EPLEHSRLAMCSVCSPHSTQKCWNDRGGSSWVREPKAKREEVEVIMRKAPFAPHRGLAATFQIRRGRRQYRGDEFSPAHENEIRQVQCSAFAPAQFLKLAATVVRLFPGAPQIREMRVPESARLRDVRWPASLQGSQ